MLEKSLRALLAKARVRGRKAARLLGEKLVARASAIACEKGLAERPITLDEALRQLDALRAQGLSREDFARLKDVLRARYGKR
ncbi:MAG: hypothetical protein AB7E47_14255 [Desulfovibrionaceae bacterium]